MSRPDAMPLPVVPPDAAPREVAPVGAMNALFGGAPARLHALDDGPGSQEAGDVLVLVLEALRRQRPGGDTVVFSLAGLPADARARLDETLADGEVTMTVTGSHVFRVRETALPGVWRVQGCDAGGRVVAELLEVGEVPAVVRAANEQGTCGELSIGRPPDGAMNVLPLLAELRHRMQTWQPGMPNHVVSFTLLPMSEVDMRHAEGQLKRGPVQAVSKGHGRCRVELTGHRNVWSVQYENAMGATILDTIEVGDVPAALKAGAEDFEDSAQRLAEVLGGG